MSDNDGFTAMSDPGFPAGPGRVRGTPEALAGRGRKLTGEFGRRAGEVGISQPGIAALSRLLAIEVLLAEPEALQDDVLEACLYILRDRLRGKAADDDQSA